MASILGPSAAAWRLAARVSSRPASRSGSSPVRALAAPGYGPGDLARRSPSWRSPDDATRPARTPEPAGSVPLEDPGCATSGATRAKRPWLTPPRLAGPPAYTLCKATCSRESWVMNARIAPRARSARSRSGSAPACRLLCAPGLRCAHKRPSAGAPARHAHDALVG